MSATPPPFGATWWRWLENPASRWVIVGIGVLLMLPALGVGLVADDWYHLLFTTNIPSLDGLRAEFWDLFRFVPAGDAPALMQRGIMPWTTDPAFQMGFFRPLASLTHAVDYGLWPGSPALMHAQNLAWFAAIIALAGVLYRRFSAAPWIAGLAMLLFAVDDAHGPVVGWVANRSALMSAAFGLAAIIAHDRWRRDGWRPGALLGPAALAFALAAGENGLAWAAYILAYASHLESKRSLTERALSLIPYAAVAAAWLLVWIAMDYGVHGSGAYLDPAGDTAAALTDIGTRGPLLLAAQLSGLWSGLSMAIAPEAFGWISLLCGVYLLLALDAFKAVIRLRPEARFWTMGAALSVIPLCGSFPSDRLLMPVSFGVMGLIAAFIALPEGEAQAVGAKGAGRLRRFTVRSWTLGLIIAHLVAAPLMAPIRANTMSQMDDFFARAGRALPHDPGVEDRTVICIQSPSDLVQSMVQVARAAHGQRVPGRLRVLASGPGAVTVTRADAATLEVHMARGWMALYPERMGRDASKRPFAIGDTIALPPITAEVMTVTPDGRPMTMRFTFDRPLEDQAFDWFSWDEIAFAPFTLPAIGDTLTLPSIDGARAYLGARTPPQ